MINLLKIFTHNSKIPQSIAYRLSNFAIFINNFIHFTMFENNPLKVDLSKDINLCGKKMNKTY